MAGTSISQLWPAMPLCSREARWSTGSCSTCRSISCLRQAVANPVCEYVRCGSHRVCPSCVLAACKTPHLQGLAVSQAHLFAIPEKSKMLWVSIGSRWTFFAIRGALLLLLFLGDNSQLRFCCHYLSKTNSLPPASDSIYPPPN